MWIFLTKGAVSIVQRNPAHLQPGDDKSLVIRSRRKEWLTAFGAYCPEMTKPAHSPTSDYQWRAYASPEQAAAAVGRAVMDVSYHNFKAATESPAHGLRSPKLRHGLHDAYNKVWGAILAAGDGTSVYDGKWNGSQAGAGTIDICHRLGHFYGAQRNTCADCGTPRPDPKTGYLRPTKAEVDAWWESHGGRPTAKRKPAAVKVSA